jgi:hypothetical protein
MFASVRRTCLEHQSRAATLLQAAAFTAWQVLYQLPPLPYFSAKIIFHFVYVKKAKMKAL